jgi:hypothetical protein
MNPTVGATYARSLTVTAGGTVAFVYDGSGSLQSWSASSDGTNGTPRVGTETRPATLVINYIIKL